MKLLSFDIEFSDVFELRKYEDMDKYAPARQFRGQFTYLLRSDGDALPH